MARSASSRRRCPWPDLQPELICLVLLRLPSHADRVRLAPVCRAWRSSARLQHPLPPVLPWLALPDGTFLRLPDGAVHRLPVPDDVSSRVSTGDALFLVHGDGRCSLTTPSPTVTTPVALPQPAFWFRRNSRANHVLNSIHKTVVSDDLVAVLKSMGLYNVFVSTRGHGLPSWQRKWAPPSGSFTADITIFKGKLHVLTMKEELHVLDAGDQQTSMVPVVKTLCKLEYQRFDSFWTDRYTEWHYLVVSGNQLLMVKRMINLVATDNGIKERTHRPSNSPQKHRTGAICPRFEVFEAVNPSDGCGWWREVDTLMGRALFVSEGCSESLPASSGVQCGARTPRNPFLDSGVYNMRDRTVAPLSLEAATVPTVHYGQWSSTWIFPKT
ncbi:hypothetical protein ZWY2020_041667 [Hordeum vulgare]|nr:hypothetical protein ZWY2020_041667 [Hordeum vulgare]